MANERTLMTETGFCLFGERHDLCYAEWVSKGKSCSCSCHKEEQ